MNREKVYTQLANDVFRRAAEEESAQLIAQWKILGSRYLELADQANELGEKDPVFDTTPWDRKVA